MALVPTTHLFCTEHRLDPRGGGTASLRTRPYGARSYDTNIGRFTQPDPSGQEQNPYRYAEGDPVNRIDPTGGVGTLAGFGCGAVMTSAGFTASAAPAVCAGVGYYAGELTADTRVGLAILALFWVLAFWVTSPPSRQK